MQEQLDPREIENQIVEQLPHHIFSLKTELTLRRRAFLGGGGYRCDSLGVNSRLRPRRLDVDPGFLPNSQLATVECVITSIADTEGRALPLANQAKRKRKLIYHDRGNPKRAYISLEEVIQPGQDVAAVTIEFECHVPGQREILSFHKGDEPEATRAGTVGSVTLKSLDQRTKRETRLAEIFTTHLHNPSSQPIFATQSSENQLRTIK